MTKFDDLISDANKVRKDISTFQVEFMDEKSFKKYARAMQGAGAKIKVNQRVHGRMFLCRYQEHKGVLILGSFDFNKEGMGEERRDVGIKTSHPDLIKSAYKYFNGLWDDEYNCSLLDDEYPDMRKKKKKRAGVLVVQAGTA